MTPKFRGNSDDWLDDQESRKETGRRKASKKAPPANALPLGEANATVAEVFPKQCRVLTDGGTWLACSYRRAAVLGHSGTELRERSPVAVGDRVKVTQGSPEAGVVEGVCARANQLIRPAPGEKGEGRDKTVHVVASNLDVLVIVASVERPEFSVGLVDRYLVAADFAGIRPVVCVTKIDLWSGGSRRKPWSIYSDVGVDLVEVCAKSGSGIEAFRSRLVGQKAAFCGHSGVGKTSLLRALLENQTGRVGDVSDATGKGRHTTTGAVLLLGPKDAQGVESRWIDTPGVREFGLHGVDWMQVRDSFPEFADLACTESGCLHLEEEGCDAVGLERHASYVRIATSVRDGEA